MFVTVLVTALLLAFASPVALAATAKSGAACSRSGEKQTVSGYIYVCQANVWKKRNQWVNKGRVSVSKPTVKPSATPKPSPSPVPTVPPVPSATPKPSPSPVPTVTPVPSATPKPSPSPVPTVTPVPSATPQPSPSPVPTVTPVPSATPQPSPSPVPTVTPVPSVSPTPNGLVLTPVPVILGFASPGNSLSVNAGAWDSGVSLSYQWFRSGVSGGSISGATDSSYVAASGDLGRSVWVRVTGSKAGFVSVESTSTPVLVKQTTNYLAGPVPVILGFPSSGNSLSVNAGVWDSGVSLSYQWFRNNFAISGATGASYLLSTNDQATSISVQVMGVKLGFVSATRISAKFTILSSFVLSPIPVISMSPFSAISNIFLQNESLTLDPGVWDAGVALSYQWFRNGVAISGEIGPKKSLRASDIGASFSATVVGIKAGFAAVTQSSSPFIVRTLIMAPVPVISGTPVAGNALTVNPGVWDPGVRLIYQWSRNGVLLGLSEFWNLYLTAADYGVSYSLWVRGIKDGFMSVTKSSEPIVVDRAPRPLTYTPIPVISGETSTGSTLSANPGVWDSGVTLSYQWFRNGVAISGSTGPNYLLTESDQGISLTVKVTGAKAGSISATQTSLPTYTYSNLILTPVPVISGIPSTGNYLIVDPGVWDPGVTLTYEWLRNGEPAEYPPCWCKVEKGLPNYKVFVSGAYHPYSVKVTGKKNGYFTVTRTSEVVYSLLNMKTTPVPYLVHAQDNSLYAVPGSWDAGVQPNSSDSSVALNYQWFRNGVAIAGATSTQYVLKSSDSGVNLSVSVTGVKSSYVSVTLSSESYLVPPS